MGGVVSGVYLHLKQTSHASDADVASHIFIFLLNKLPLSDADHDIGMTIKLLVGDAVSHSIEIKQILAFHA